MKTFNKNDALVKPTMMMQCGTKARARDVNMTSDHIHMFETTHVRNFRRVWKLFTFLNIWLYCYNNLFS